MCTTPLSPPLLTGRWPVVVRMAQMKLEKAKVDFAARPRQRVQAAAFTANSILREINDSEVFNVKLAEKDINQILDLLVWVSLTTTSLSTCRWPEQRRQPGLPCPSPRVRGHSGTLVRCHSALGLMMPLSTNLQCGSANACRIGNLLSLSNDRQPRTRPSCTRRRPTSRRSRAASRRWRTLNSTSPPPLSDGVGWQPFNKFRSVHI